MTTPRKAARRVLVIDDDPQFSQIICAILSLAGAVPTCVESLGAAWVELRRSQFHVVFLDLALPDSTAPQTIDQIGEICRRAAGASVVIITGSTITQDLERKCVVRGASAALAKDDPQFMDRILGALAE